MSGLTRSPPAPFAACACDTRKGYGLTLNPERGGRNEGPDGGGVGGSVRVNIYLHNIYYIHHFAACACDSQREAHTGVRSARGGSKR